MKYDSRIFEAILQMLASLSLCSCVEFEKTEQDGVFDYWDYKILAKSPQGVSAEFTVRFAGVPNQGEEYTVSELETKYRKISDFVDVATTLLASKKYTWKPYSKA